MGTKNLRVFLLYWKLVQGRLGSGRFQDSNSCQPIWLNWRIFSLQAEKAESNKPKSPSKPKAKKVQKSKSPPKPKSKKVKKSSGNGKELIRQRPHLDPSTLNNNNNNNNDHDVSSSDEDDQTVKSAAESRITYAMAMNNRTAQDGSGSSGISGSSGSGSGSNAGSSNSGINGGNGANVVSESTQQQTVERYPKRERRHVNYCEPPCDEDSFICK